MTPRRAAFAALIAVAAIGIGWLLFVGLPRWYGGPVRTTAAAPPSNPASDDVRKIKARLFYVSQDGTRLTSVEREVPFAEQTVAQARRIVEAQLAPVAPTPPAPPAASAPQAAPAAPAPAAAAPASPAPVTQPAATSAAPPPASAVSAVPAGTTLRAIFVTDQGTAFVDLSQEIASAHPGGSINELLTIYTIVQALTTNLPAITSVQLLVGGKEIDTLAGHVDIKRPLARADQWVAENVSR
jgi:hypothetical protein